MPVLLYAEGVASKKYARHLERVLLVDPLPASARLLHELLKDLGGRYIRLESSLKGAMTAAREDDPQIIFTELKGPALDGLEFTRQLRKSDLGCRQAPIIIVTGEATASSIIGARDSGVHEFLRKPYTIKDLVRRLEAVTLKSRDWVEGVRYIGPDRRRFNSGDYQGPRKRKSDQMVTPAAGHAHSEVCGRRPGIRSAPGFARHAGPGRGPVGGRQCYGRRKTGRRRGAPESHPRRPGRGRPSQPP